MSDDKLTNECCPPFEPEKWNEQIFHWNNKIFVRSKVKCLFHIPLNFGIKMRKLVPKIEKTGAQIADGMILSDHPSPWSMNLYIAVDKVIPGIENITLTGDFLFRVYEGSFNMTGKWSSDFSKWVAEKGHEMKHLYLWYTTCPKCARKYGKNYVVLLGEVV
jgi:hypothetical protein